MKIRKLNANYIYNSIYQLVTLLLPIALTPFITRTIGAEGIGQYSYTRSIVTYFVLFGTVGSNLYAQREIAYTQTDVRKKSTVFWEIFLLRCILLTISIAVYLPFAFCADHYAALLLIQILDILAAYADITWYFQGVENFKKITTRNIIVKLFTVIAIFLLIRSPEDLYLYICIYSVGNFIGQALLWRDIRQEIQKVSYKELRLRRHLKGILQLFVPQISIQIYLLIDKTMIELITGNSSETGYYELAQTIQRACVAVVTAYGTVAASRVAAFKSQDKGQEIKDLLTQSHELICLFAFPIAFGIMAIAHNLIPWFMGPDYGRVADLLMMLCPLVVIIGFSNISGMQYLVPMGMQNRMSVCSAFGAVINVLFNMCAIPWYGAFGAAAASVLAELAVLICQGLFLRNLIDRKRILLSMSQAMAGSVIMLFCLKMTERYLLYTATMTHTIILTIEGIIIYGAVQLLLKNRLLWNMRSFLWSKRGKE